VHELNRVKNEAKYSQVRLAMSMTKVYASNCNYCISLADLSSHASEALPATLHNHYQLCHSWCNRIWTQACLGTCSHIHTYASKLQDNFVRTCVVLTGEGDRHCSGCNGNGNSCWRPSKKGMSRLRPHLSIQCRSPSLGS